METKDTPVNGTASALLATAEQCNSDSPEAIAFALTKMALRLAPHQRSDMLDLFAECLTAALGKREPRELRGGLH